MWHKLIKFTKNLIECWKLKIFNNQHQDIKIIYYGSVIKPDHARILIFKYTNGTSLMKLSNEYGYNIATIRYFLKKNGIYTRTVKESVIDSIKTKEILGDDFLRENIIGWLLGDGGIRIFKGAVNPVFNYTDQHKDHILYVNDILNKYNIKTNITYNKHNSCYSLQTEALPYFKQFYDLFYGYPGLNENGQKRKILPDIKITPIILRNWFIGDGCSSKGTKTHNHRGVIADKFKNDFILEQLVSLFNTSDGGRVTCCSDGHNSIYGYKYYFNNKSFIKMLEYIGECPVESYRYKWITKSEKI